LSRAFWSNFYLRSCSKFYLTGSETAMNFYTQNHHFRILCNTRNYRLVKTGKWGTKASLCELSRFLILYFICML
jgi:hypothetical protein